MFDRVDAYILALLMLLAWCFGAPSDMLYVFAGYWFGVGGRMLVMYLSNRRNR